MTCTSLEKMAGAIAVIMVTMALTGAEIKLQSDCLWTDLASSASDGTLVITADSPCTVTVSQDAVLPDTLDIGDNVQIKVANGVSLRRARQADIPSVTIRAGGYLGFHSQTARLLTPVDLSITTGGSLDMNYDSGSSTRAAFIARTYYLDGTKQGSGTKKTSADANAPIKSRDANSALLVPGWFWTGAAGDNVFETGGNWLGGSAPKTSTYSIYDTIDLSCATGTVRLTSSTEFKVLGVAYLPAAAGSELTLSARRASGALLSINGIGGDYGVAGVCGLGSTLVCDVDYANIQTSNRKIYSGGGTWRFNKSFSPNSGTAFPVPLLDGVFEIGGTLEKTCLSWGRVGNLPSAWRFSDGARVTTDYLGSEVQGFWCGTGYVQDGGSVVTTKYLCASTTRTDGQNFLYELNNGSLAVTTELVLGGAQKLANTANPVYPTGSFTMNSGTLAVQKVSTECNSNYCRLLGGTATIGTDGFVLSSTTHSSTAANTTSPIVLGAVTLLADGAGWSVAADLTQNGVAGVSLEGAAYGPGRTVFAPVGGQTITVNGDVSGTGGLVKSGAGGLVFAGTYGATGAIRVEGGTLTLGTVSSTLDMLDLADNSSLSLGSSVTLHTRRLVVGGERRGSGTYSFGSGIVEVAADTCDFIGPDGGDWNTAANWSNGVVPNDDGSELDFTYSAVSSISVSSPVTIKKMTVPNGLTLTGNAALTIATDGLIDVPGGKILTNDVPVHVAGPVQKTGAGKVVFTKRLRSSADPAAFEGKQNYELRIVQGEGEVACAVNGIRLYADSQTAADDPLLVISDGASVTNSYVHGPWTMLARAGYGRVVMNGGVVNVTGAEYFYGTSGPNQREYGFAYMEFGTCSFAFNGGTFIANQADNVRFNLHNNANDNGGEVTVTVDGGSFIRTREYVDTWIGGSKKEKLILNSGSFETYNFTVARSGRSEERTLELNGGTLGFSRAIATAFSIIKVGGDVTISQRYKYTEESKQCKIEPAVTGTGKVTQSGMACLRLNDVSGFAGDFAVTGGSIAFSGAAGFNAASSLSVASGAMVELDYEGSKDIKALTLNGRVAYRGCEYGAEMRGKAYFAGTGLLVPTTGLTEPGIKISVR